MRDPKLWERLRAHRFDDPSEETPFSVRLAQAAGWTDRTAAAVIEEYRRFIYLSQVAPGRVTPSEDVDRVWHMHMTCTRAYWDDLCGRTLKAPLHHEPATGTADDVRHVEQYEATLALYEQEFGAPPPPRVWPRNHAPSMAPWFIGAAVAFGIAFAVWHGGGGRVAVAIGVVAALLAWTGLRRIIHPPRHGPSRFAGVSLVVAGGSGDGGDGGGCGD